MAESDLEPLAYNPDQPRDEHGRFTSGGGSGAPGPKKTPARKVPPGRLRARLNKLQSDHDRIQDRLAEKTQKLSGQYKELTETAEQEPNEFKRAAIREKADKVYSRWEKAFNEHEERKTSLIERARKLVEVPESQRSDQQYHADHQFPNGKVADEGVLLYRRYVSKDTDLTQPIIFTENKDGDGRSWADHEGRFVALDHQETNPGVVAHELGHLLEANHPANMTASVNFLQRRTQGESFQKLKDLTGMNYAESEVTKPDKFHNPYVGKEYADLRGRHYATEVTSMGIERLHENPLEFAKNDPDYFDHTLNVLRGRYL